MRTTEIGSVMPQTDVAVDSAVLDTMGCCYNAVNVLQIPYKLHLTDRPLGRYGMYFVGSNSDLFSHSVQWCISYWLRYNGTRLYLDNS